VVTCRGTNANAALIVSGHADTHFQFCSGSEFGGEAWTGCSSPPGDCDPAYPDVGIPPPPDLDCADLPDARQGAPSLSFLETHKKGLGEQQEVRFDDAAARARPEASPPCPASRALGAPSPSTDPGRQAGPGSDPGRDGFAEDGASRGCPDARSAEEGLPDRTALK